MDVSSISRLNLAGPAGAGSRLEYNPVPVPEIVAAVRALNKSEMFGENRQLAFARDTETNRPVIRIVNRQTGETIEQIPPEAVLHMLAGLEQPSANEGVGQ